MKLGMRIQVESIDHCSTYSLTAAAAACLQKHGGNFTVLALGKRMKAGMLTFLYVLEE